MVIKMDRAYVICHMAVSLDGKIDGDFHEAEKSEKAGAYYYDVIFDLGSSMAGGRVTTRMYSPQPEVDYEKYKGVDVPEGDYIVQNAQGHYCLVYDREGRCTWEAPVSTMNGISMQIVEVVTKAARKEYLAYLRDMGISYLITEDEEHPVRESLEKLKRLYGVERLVLTGGASINGGFLKENMIDEFSVVVLPYVDGDKQHKALVDTDGAFFDRAFYFAEAKPLEGGAVHMRYIREQ